MSERKRRWRVLLPILVLVLAGAVAAWLVLTREPPQRETGRPRATLVETLVVERRATRLDIEAKGTILPAREVAVQPQVQGKVVRVNPSLEPGGLVREGELLFALEETDYQVAVQQARAALTEARAQLAQEEGRQDVAEAEWEAFKGQLDEVPQDRRLALRVPQVQAAEAAVQRAEAQLRQARANLQRTEVRAPFDALVRSESVGVGSFASPQAQVAQLMGVDRFWVQVHLPVARLGYIDIPGVTAAEGAPVTVRQELGERSVQRDGRVVRLLGGLDPEGRMARLLAAIPDPLNLDGGGENATGPRGLPLLVDAFVEVTIQGNRVLELIEIPREYLHEGDRVWVFGEDGRLDIREVGIAWRRPDAVLIERGLEAGERIVTSRIGSPVTGMRLRTEEDGDG